MQEIATRFGLAHSQSAFHMFQKASNQAILTDSGLGFNPHCHTLVTDGCFYGRNGMFRVALPLELKKLEAIFRHKVFKMLLAKGKITEEMIAMLSTWRHSGFSLHASTTRRHDYLNAYVSDLGNVIDMDAIRDAKICLGVDPLGGAGVHYWGPIAERYGLNLTVVNESVEWCVMLTFGAGLSAHAFLFRNK